MCYAQGASGLMHRDWASVGECYCAVCSLAHRSAHPGGLRAQCRTRTSDSQSDGAGWDPGFCSTDARSGIRPPRDEARKTFSDIALALRATASTPPRLRGYASVMVGKIAAFLNLTRRSTMHAVVRTYSGAGAKQVFDVLEQRKADVENHPPESAWSRELHAVAQWRWWYVGYCLPG